MADNELPIALRRARRSSTVKLEPCCDAAAPRLAAKTPRRARKTVRFSDPGLSTPSASSGLTPSLRRVSVVTPRRRHSTPSRSTPSRSTPGRSPGPGAFPKSPGLPESGDVTFLPLRQVLDGRVQRRIRRNHMSEEMNSIQQERKQRAQKTKAEIDRLRTELKLKDREIYELQNATIVMDTDRIWDLEQQIDDLKSQLSKQSQSTNRGYDWAMTPTEPFSDDLMDLTNDQDEFGETTMAQLQGGTPSRARSSFLSPPPTSPIMSGIPCSSPILRASLPSLPSRTDFGVQASFVDPAQQRLEDEVASLQLEVRKITDTLNSYHALSSRLTNDMTLDDESETCPVKALEGQIESLLRAMSDRSAALSQLTSSISGLGFPGNDASEMITSLVTGLRAARLELEYLTPGEITLPLSSHGAEVLDLLLTRLRDMAKKAKEDEDSIDEYHEIELSLRKQLDARVSVMDGLKAEMAKAEKIMSDKSARIKELEIGNERLKGAVDGYIRDISELEKLVERMEKEGQNVQIAHEAERESNRRVLTSKEDNIAELETKLNDALERSTNLQKQMLELQESKAKDFAALNHKHGQALALRDARVIELRGEIDRVNDSLRAAHETIRSLRVDNGGLKNEMEEEQEKAKTVIDSMKEELQRVLQMSQDFLNTPKPGRRDSSIGDSAQKDGQVSESHSGRLLSAGLARRKSKNQRRRHDSGLYLLDEDEVEMF